MGYLSIYLSLFPPFIIINIIRPFTTLQLKFRPLLLHPNFPFPLLPTSSLDTLIHPPQLHGEARPEFLQTGTDTFDAWDFLAVRADDAFFGFALVAEDVAVAAHLCWLGISGRVMEPEGDG